MALSYTEFRPIGDAPKDRHIQAMVDGKLLWVEWNEAWGREGWFVLNHGCRIVEPTVYLAVVENAEIK